MGGVIYSRVGVLSEHKRQDLTRYFQSLDTDSGEFIAIDQPRWSHFRSKPTTLYQRNSDDAVCSYFWSPLLHHCRPRTACIWKSAKVLSMTNCGMRVAMDIGVIRDHVSRVYRYFWRAGYDVWKTVYLDSLFRKARGTIGPPRCGER
jgi:hypothetical protein